VQVGISLSVKTLADRPEPLDDVYRMFTADVVAAEQLGFDYVSVSEHHFEEDAWSPSPLVLLSHFAARTSRIRLHTNVFLLPLHQPLRVSEDVATVDLLSGGRVDLICGAGSVLEEFVAFGVDAKSRWSRFWESMEIIRRSYTDDLFTFEGKHFSIPDPIRQTTKPKQNPFPLWVGGFGPKLQYRSGQNGYHSQGGPNPHPEYLRGLAEAGVDPATRNHACFSTGHLAPTKEQAWAECREGWWNRQNEYRKRTWIAHPGAPDLEPLAEYEKLDLPPENLWMSPVIGNPDDILELLRPVYEHSGTTHFSFSFRSSGGGMPADVARRSIELFVKECLPVMKGWGREPTTSRAAD
jgi:alkanesulfonate monooxygenase SsuD/methylene tetrahydromethanopterin reductase-like flavin-dependent oxidoreductase (luciferase family)